jgi:hypothetical protein
MRMRDCETGAQLHRGVRPMTLTYKGESITRLICPDGIISRTDRKTDRKMELKASIALMI